jgi:hypothetical protein
VPNWTPGALARQIRIARQNGLLGLLTGAADRHGLPRAFVVAVASRESNLRNILGDLRGDGYHGVGSMQIDVQHEIARTARDHGTWKTAQGPLIEYGAALLAENRSRVRTAFPAFTAEQDLKVAASGYNCGIGRALEGSRDHGDSDYHTTGRDYGADVMRRMRAIEEIGL